jgi:hypothetical protein
MDVGLAKFGSVIHHGMMENIADASSAAADDRSLGRGRAAAVIGSHHELHVGCRRLGGSVIDSGVNRLDGPEQRREENDQETPDHGCGLALLAGAHLHEFRCASINKIAQSQQFALV